MIENRIDDDCALRYSYAASVSIDNVGIERGQVIGNVGQRSPRGTVYDHDRDVSPRGQASDNVGQRPPLIESNFRILEFGVASNSIDFSQSVTQILANLEKEGYVNPRERLAVISAYTDTWKETMIARFNNQEERLLGLEDQAINSRNTISRYEDACTVFKMEVVKLNEMIKYHERTVPSWRKEIDESLGNAKMILGKVENRMEEFMVWINHFRETNRNEDIPVEVINSLQELIQDTSAVSSV